MPVRFRKIPIWKRLFEKQHVCMICGKAPATHWGHMVDNKGNFVSNPEPTYFHYSCVLTDMDKKIAESDKQIKELLEDKEKEA